MTVFDRVMAFIQDNKISTAEVGDALGKIGGVANVSPLKNNFYAVGELFYTCAYAESNWNIHNDVANTPKNSIVFVDNLDSTDKALFGEIVSRFIIEKKQAKAIVTNGKIRDVSEMLSLSIPIWHAGTNPIGCFNSKPVFTDTMDELAQKRKIELNGSIVVCDDDGVVIIKKDQITDDFLDRLKKLQQQEKVWKECVFEKEWDTFETICLKRYMK